MRTLKKLNKSLRFGIFLFAAIGVVFVYQSCGKFGSRENSLVQGPNININNFCPERKAMLPRLTPYEYGQIVNDLMGGDFDSSILSALPTFPTLYGFDRLANPPFDRASAEAYINVAESLAAQLTRDQSTLAGCNMKIPFYEKTWDNCALPVVLKAGRALYRRPLRASEVADFKAFFLESLALGHQRIRTSVSAIQGFLDSVGNRPAGAFGQAGVYAEGWAYDPDWPERSVQVKVYVKNQGAGGVGTYLGSALANLPRPDVNAALGTTGDHGFLFPIPVAYLNGASFEVTTLSYGTATDQPLNNSPKLLSIVSNLSGSLATGELDQPFKDALSATLVSLAASPNFLFKMEYYPGGFEENEENFRKASILSLLTGSTFPDIELADKAEKGSLDLAELKVQAARLLNKYSDRFAESFGGYWIGYKNNLSKDRNSLEFSMGEEGRLVFKEILLQNSPISSILKPGYTYANSILGAHYGLAGGASATNFLKVSSAERGGMLNQAHFLMRTANSVQTNPIKRGTWVLDKVLCRSLPALDAATFEEIANVQNKIDPNASLVERMEIHRTYGSRCAACHFQIDPLGLGLEKWDMAGQFRSNYSNGKPVLSGLDFEGHKVDSPSELADAMSSSKDFRNCVRIKLAAYVQGIDPTQGSSCGRQIASDIPLKELAVDTIVDTIQEKK